MNIDVELTLRNLGVIAALSQNDKINTREDNFSIYTPTTFRGLARMVYYKEGREHNIQKISHCIRDAKSFIVSGMNEIHEDASSLNSEFLLNAEKSTESTQDTMNYSNLLQKLNISTKNNTCTRMRESLKKSINGLHSLSTTYKEDASCTSRLENLIHEIQDFLSSTRDVARSSPVLQRIV